MSDEFGVLSLPRVTGFILEEQLDRVEAGGYGQCENLG